MTGNMYSLKQLVEMTEDWNSSLSDDRSDIKDMKFSDDFTVSYPPMRDNEGNGLFSKVEGVTQISTLNERAFAQLCHRLVVPATWARDPEKCPPDLRRRVINWKFKNHQRDSVLLRLREAADKSEQMICRAVLSDQYTPYDHWNLVDALREAIEQGGYEVDIWRPDIDDNFRCYVLIKGIDFEAPSGNGQSGDGGGSGGTRPAVYVSNSEVGVGSVKVTGGLYRGWCSNGMIIGWKQESAFAITHRFKTRGRMAFYINEAIATSLNMSEEAAIAFLQTQEAKIAPAKVKDIIEGWARKYGIVVAAREQWAALCQHQVQTKGEITQFDAINWLTSVASGWDNSDRREEMEVVAGRLIHENVPARFRETDRR